MATADESVYQNGRYHWSSHGGENNGLYYNVWCICIILYGCQGYHGEMMRLKTKHFQISSVHYRVKHQQS